MKKIIGIIFSVIGAATTCLGCFSKIATTKSISIIGGSDGPTSIFLAGKLGSWQLPTILVGICVFVVGIGLALKGKK